MSTSEKLRTEAAEAAHSAAESFERCDTDGCLSQWADRITATLKNTQADLLDAGGVAEFPGLFEGERRVEAKLIEGKFGPVWLVLGQQDEDRFGRFVPYGRRSRKQKTLGLHEAKETASAAAKIAGEGRGLAGAANCRVTVFRTDGGWPEEGGAA